MRRTPSSGRGAAGDKMKDPAGMRPEIAAILPCASATTLANYRGPVAQCWPVFALKEA